MAARGWWDSKYKQLLAAVCLSSICACAIEPPASKDLKLFAVKKVTPSDIGFIPSDVARSPVGSFKSTLLEVSFSTNTYIPRFLDARGADLYPILYACKKEENNTRLHTSQIYLHKANVDHLRKNAGPVVATVYEPGKEPHTFIEQRSAMEQKIAKAVSSNTINPPFTYQFYIPIPKEPPTFIEELCFYYKAPVEMSFFDDNRSNTLILSKDALEEALR